MRKIPSEKALLANKRLAATVYLLFAAMLVMSVASSVNSLTSGVWSVGTFLLWIDQTLINTTIVILGLMIIRRHLNVFALPAALYVGETLYDGRYLVGNLHAILDKTPMYHWAFGRHATQSVNPQYAMLIVFVALLVILLVMTTIKRTRTFDRIMTTVFAVSVLTTFTIFHIFLIGGIQTAISMETRVLTSAFDKDEGVFLGRCHEMEVKCQVVFWDDPARDRTGAAVDPIVARTVADIATRRKQLRAPFAWSETFLKDGTASQFFAAAVATTQEHILIAQSGGAFTSATDYEELRFTVQSIAAHGTWFVIFALLVAIHRKRARPNVRRFIGERGFA